MGRACSTNWAKKNTYRILAGKPEGNRPLLTPRRRWWIVIWILERQVAVVWIGFI
jgi:hypothetical protein